MSGVKLFFRLRNFMNRRKGQFNHILTVNFPSSISHLVTDVHIASNAVNLMTFSINSNATASSVYISKIQRDATVCRCLFTAELLYMFRVSIAPIVRSTSNCNCSFCTGHSVRATTFRQRGL